MIEMLLWDIINLSQTCSMMIQGDWTKVWMTVSATQGRVGQEAMEEERRFAGNGLPTMKRFTRGNWSKRVDTRARAKTVRIDCSPQKQEGCFLYEQYLVRLVTIVKYCENVSVRAKASMDGITVI